MKPDSTRLLFISDLAATFIFAVEGAFAAISGDLDFLGLMVLAFATALGGGVIRDLLIGAVPPAALRDWRYPTTAFSAGILVFFLHHYLRVIPGPVMIALDAAGLSLFAVAGADKALAYRMHPFIGALLGTITGVGGGTIRDVFLAQVPNVLQADVYATAAFAGASVMILARRFGTSPVLSAVLGGVICFVLRVVSVWQHWNLPHVTS